MSYRDFGDECGCPACTDIGGKVAADLGREASRERMSKLRTAEGLGSGKPIVVGDSKGQGHEALRS